MQRKMLEELGLEKEVIDKVMAENGADIERAKEKLEAERDNYKTQLETAQEALKGFDGVDVQELQGKITQLTNDLAAKETEYQNKLSDMEFASVLDSEIAASGARNATAVKALLKLDELKASKNQSEDVRKALEAVKTENDYLFTSDEPIKSPVKPTNGTLTGITKEMFAKMGYSERLELKKSNPEKYNELKG